MSTEEASKQEGEKPTEPAADYLTPKEAAERLGIKAVSIYKAMERGQIPFTMILGRKAIKASDVDAYQPASYGGTVRAVVRRGPGRPRKSGETPEVSE